MAWKVVIERVVGDVVVLDLTARLVLSSDVLSLEEKIHQLLGQDRLKILLNLTHAPYIDSLDFGEIIRGYTATARAGGALKFFGAAPRVRALFVSTQLDRLFQLFESEREAIESFATSV